MARRSLSVALVSAALLIGLFPAGAAAETPPLPVSMAAVGDSITQAASSGGSLGADYPENSWATGTNATVNSHYLRLLALNPAIQGANHNRSVSGAKMADLQGQMQQVALLQPDYLTVLIGGNDICTDTEAQMTSVADFRAQFQVAMATIASASPNTHVYVVSIPRVLGLWELFRNNWWARFVWSVGDICQSLLANPTSTQTADVERRARVAQRNVDFNQVLYEVCSAAPRCLWDGWAVYSTPFTSGDAAGDYFHPSVQGQAKLAAVSWAAGHWADGAPPPSNQAPSATFAVACSDLACAFDGSTSTDADGSIVSYAWAFGSDGAATGVTASHTFSAAGTYVVSLTVTDDDAATDTATQSLVVTGPDPAGTVSLGALEGEASSRKGGWTASVTVTVVDGSGSPVGGATVSGSWSSGGGASCATTGSGTCSMSTNVSKKATSVTWTVSGITHASLAYDPAGNVDNAVTISRP